MSHTPGPWRVERVDYPAGEDVSFEVSGPGAFVAQTIMRDVKTEQERIGADEANVRLISTAPDMLAALKAVCAALNGRVHSNPALRALQSAEDVIAKAEGR